MTRSILIGSPPIEVHLRRSNRARRYSLKVSNTDGKISLTLPIRASEKEAVNFAHKQESWLRNALGRLPEQSVPVFGGTIRFEGRDMQVLPVPGRRVLVRDQAIMVPGKPEQLTAKLRGFLKVTARARLAAASQNYADQLGRNVTRITLRDTKSRWGSCTSTGNLMFSWRLIMAPPQVLDYVAAHEVAHLIEMNHSAGFWKIVADVMPDYADHRRWLKENGTELHRIQF